VADGYNLIAIAADPPAVPVAGPLEALQAVTYLTTEPIDASGLRNDLTRTVRLRLPAGFITTRDSVTVRLHVVPARGEVSLSVAPQVTNVGEGLRATVQTSAVAVRVGGELPALRAMQPSALRVSVNASGLAEGVHVLSPTLSVPTGVEVISTDPQQVVVVLRR
jgi:YbbR domain-containing protein